MSRYIDDDFVLQGRKTPMREKPVPLSNSQLTTTTRSLSQNTLYNPDNYKVFRKSLQRVNGDDSDVSQLVHALEQISRSLNDSLANSNSSKKKLNHSKNRKSVEEVALDLNRLSNSFNNSLKKSVSFKNDKPKVSKDDDIDSTLNDDEIDAELQRLIDEDDAENELIGKPAKASDSEWFVKPRHLHKKGFSGYHNEDLTALGRPEGNIGAALAADINHEKRHLHSSLDLMTYPPTTGDQLAEYYFPTTFRSTYVSVDSPASRSLTISPPPKSLLKSGTMSMKPKRSKSPIRRPQTAATTMTPIDKMYTLSASTPTIGQSTVALTSPYQHELARLRMERLRIEEDHILEVKRTDEIERIRGPQPKWYELKTPQFHYEAHKNNKLMKSENNWQDLLDYRTSLVNASKDFQKTFNYNYDI